MINYCSWATGDDTTGDGTSGNPYKTINKASNGLTGGDEVRVEKSPASTDLSGTIAWVHTAHTFISSADLTAELVPGDFIRKTGPSGGNDTWWEVSVIDPGFIELSNIYSGDTETIQSQKLGYTDTGAAAYSSEIIQFIDAAGATLGNLLTITGGWTLATETQDGETWFCQNTPGNWSRDWGVGCRCDKKFLAISNINFLRYYYGFYTFGLTQSTITGMHCNWCGRYGFYAYNIEAVNASGLWSVGCVHYDAYFYYCNSCTFTNCKFNSSHNTGLYMSKCSGLTFNMIICKCSHNYGIYLNYGRSNVFNIASIEENESYGMYLRNYTADNTFIDCNVVNNGGTYGINLYECYYSKFSNLYVDGHITGVRSYRSLGTVIDGYSGNNNSPWAVIALFNSVEPELTVLDYQLPLNDYRLWDEGSTLRVTSIGQTLTGSAIKFQPTSNEPYIYHSWFCNVCENQGRLVSIWMKHGGDGTNLTAYGTLYFKNRAITSSILIALTDQWTKYEFLAEAMYIPQNGVLELRIMVKGANSRIAWADMFSEYTSEDVMTTLMTHREKTESNLERVLTATEIRQVIIDDPSASVTEFITDLTETVDAFWDRNALVFTSGENKGVMRKIQNYYSWNKKIKVRTALPYAPADGDTFIIVPARAFRLNYADVNGLVDDIYDEAKADHTALDSFGEGFNDIITDVPLIKDKTDLLPGAPADQLLVEAAIAAAEGNVRGVENDDLDTISDQIDAVALKTDLLTFDVNNNVHSVPKDTGACGNRFDDIDNSLDAAGGRFDNIDNMLAHVDWGLPALEALIEGIDTSNELEARFTEIKGIDWTNETLKAIKDAIDAGGGRDWSDVELRDIRGALGVDGIKTTPVDGQLQDIKTNTDKLQFAGDNDVLATLNGERVNLTDPTEAKLNGILIDTSEIEEVRAQTDKIQFNAENDVKATLDGEEVVVDSVIPLTLELLKKIGTNKLELSPGVSNNWILFDDDNLTPLLTFSVRDKNGFAIELADGAPARRTKGL